MEKELMETLQRIARRYDKNEDLSMYVKNGRGMWIDKINQLVKFNHILSQNEAMCIVDEIVLAFRECGYEAHCVNQQQLSPILFEYTISYKK